MFVSVGGGGLISGIGGYLNQVQPEAKIVACSPKNSCVMYESLNAGRILDLPSKQTLSDGTAGGVEEGSITYDICKKVIDDFNSSKQELESKSEATPQLIPSA